MARMFNPPHPGYTLRDDVLPALGLGVSEAAKALGVSRVTLSRVLNGHAAISPDLALRLEAWLGIERGGDAAVWLAEQASYDLWQAAISLQNKPKPISAIPEVAHYAEAVALEATSEQVEWGKARGPARSAIAAALASSLNTFSAASPGTRVSITEVVPIGGPSFTSL